MTYLVTGGAGFIGSHLVRRLVGSGADVRVLDDLSTGTTANLVGVEADLVVGDVRDADVVRRMASGVDAIFHLAALPSVARSIADPQATHSVNVTGTLVVLEAARAAGTRRIVYASSSSVYGDTATLPKHEDLPTTPRSPYAVSKLAGEAYCRAYWRSFGLETVSLRFFNVFGPRQDPASEYAAVVPRFITRMLVGRSPVVLGDGRQTRDFTYIRNVVEACVLAASAPMRAAGETVNIGCGERTSLLELVELLNRILDVHLEPEHEPPRPGDVRDSQASIARAGELIAYRPAVDLRRGLTETVRSFATEVMNIA